MIAMITATAPGKLVIMGEYAVLYGHAAVVAAVDVRAVCTREAGPFDAALDAGGLVQACLTVAADAAGDVDGRVVVDTSAFRAGNDKYGLGSSAAACVALLRALRPDIRLNELHAMAQRAHRSFQSGRGSGVDVCASVFGGVQRFVRLGPDVVEVAPLPGWPAGLTLLPVWTGVSADTRVLLAQVERAADLVRHMDALGAASEKFQAATLPHEALAAVNDAHQALVVLGAAAGVDIVSDPHRNLARLARAHGGAAKPSGAGGGDVGLCFVPDDNAAALRAMVEREGYTVLPFALGAPGVDVVLAER